MKTVVWRLAVVALCTLALGATVLGSPMADTGTSPDDNGQLLDVSNAVTGVQKKLDDLLAHGRWARTGTLLASADCGYGTPAPYFAAWGDSSSYALAPHGDFASTDAWTLNKQATVVTGGDPFTDTAYSLQLAKDAPVATPAMCVNLDVTKWPSDADRPRSHSLPRRAS